jgi:transcription elongation GreA/GreB family factor
MVGRNGMKQPRPATSKKPPKVAASNTGAQLAVPQPTAADPSDDPVRNRKTALRGLLIEGLQTALASAHAAYRAAIEGATHAEAKAENSKDTRGLEQSYVARGQAQRVAELETGLATVTTMTVEPHPSGPVRIGTLAELRDQHDGRTASYWIAPAGGGTTLLDRGPTGPRELVVLTPQSPLGRALLTRNVGDEITLGEGPTQRVLDLEAIA